MISWTTDLHLDMATENAYKNFVKLVKEQNPSILLIAGDIALTYLLKHHLKQFSFDLPMEIYFVLGNHDFYRGGAIKDVRDGIGSFAKTLPRCHYLTQLGVITLSPKVALIGHDGWVDGRAGDYENSQILLRDYFEITDFLGLSKNERLNRLHVLGTQAEMEIERKLKEALKQHDDVILLTHVPPFAEASYYANNPSTSEWTPHFVSKCVGDMLQNVMSQYPRKRLTVLCGHTHHKADITILPNLRVIVGHADYGAPLPQPILNIGV